MQRGKATFKYVSYKWKFPDKKVEVDEHLE